MPSDNFILDRLSDKIEIILRLELQGISEFDLLKRLELDEIITHNNFKLKEKLNANSLNQNLFVKHFLVTHLLYRLQDKYKRNSGWVLDVNPINIQLRIENVLSNKRNNQKNKFLRLEEEHKINLALKSYYLDLNNLNMTDPDELLVRFWSDYFKKSRNSLKKSMGDKEREHYYKRLNLDSKPTKPHSLDSIRKHYRNLIKDAHPDLGGSAEYFIQIREAYEGLKAEFE